MSQEPDVDTVVGYELEQPWLPEQFGPSSTWHSRCCVACSDVLGGVRVRVLTWGDVEAAVEWQRSAFGLEVDVEGIMCCHRCGYNLLGGESSTEPLVGGHWVEAVLLGKYCAEAATAEALLAALLRTRQQYCWDEESEAAKAFADLSEGAYHRRLKELHPEEKPVVPTEEAG